MAKLKGSKAEDKRKKQEAAKNTQAKEAKAKAGHKIIDREAKPNGVPSSRFFSSSLFLVDKSYDENRSDTHSFGSAAVRAALRVLSSVDISDSDAGQ